MNFDNFFADLARLESLLGLPEDFVIHLLEEDDWSFVIKGHAVVESAVTHLLVARCDDRLAPVFERLPLGGGKTGKLAFVDHLDLLPEEALQFVRRFADLRNRLVHGAGAFSFNLSEYVGQMPPSERRGLVRQLAAAIGLGGDQDLEARGEAFLIREPKTAFAFAIFGVLAQTLFSIDPRERDRAADKAADSAGAVALMILVGLAVGTQGARKLFGGSRNSHNLAAVEPNKRPSEPAV